MTSLSSDSRCPGSSTSNSSNGGDVANNNNHLPKDASTSRTDIVVCRTKMRDQAAVGNGHVATVADGRGGAKQGGSICQPEQSRTIHPRTQMESQSQGDRTATAHPSSSAASPSTIDSCDPARYKESSQPAATSPVRHHRSSSLGDRDMTDSASPGASTTTVGSTVQKPEDPYAELERILEKVQYDFQHFTRQLAMRSGFKPR
uniref:Uncharacterized protein n=1 Tax=Anopheles melas TaxID=34690 RepID=A0A182TEI8_9DIPT